MSRPSLWSLAKGRTLAVFSMVDGAADLLLLPATLPLSQVDQAPLLAIKLTGVTAFEGVPAACAAPVRGASVHVPASSFVAVLHGGPNREAAVTQCELRIHGAGQTLMTILSRTIAINGELVADGGALCESSWDLAANA